MGDTFMVIIVIGTTLILMFMIPLTTTADRLDDVTQLTVSAATAEFGDNIRVCGEITPEEYDKFVQTLTSTGNLYDVEFLIKILDENPNKKAVQVIKDKMGENYYYEESDSNVKAKLESGQPYKLKEGDRVGIVVKIASQTTAEQLRNFIYSILGNNNYGIAAQYAVIVTKNG